MRGRTTTRTARAARYLAGAASVLAAVLVQAAAAQTAPAHPAPSPSQAGPVTPQPAPSAADPQPTDRAATGPDQGGASTTPSDDATTAAIAGTTIADGAALDGQAGQPGDVVVTGYRRSLEDQANAKKNATNFIDSIYAEDIGKFPDLNLAESLQRLPGVQIDRDTSGEGAYINVRGLSAGFTVLTVNGFAISTSSNGGNEGRGSSLDILPSELFRRVTLSKSPTASTVEGGTAGVVDLQPVRAFDRKGFHVSVQGQASYQDGDGTTTPRAAAIVSDTWEDTPLGDIGVLVAGAWAKRTYRSEIFNTVGYTTLSLGSQCPTTRAGCNSLSLDPASLPASNTANRTPGYGGGAGATLTTVPLNVPSELGLGAAGSKLTQCLQGQPGGTSGLSCEALSYAIVPRLVRAEQVVGSRDRKTGMVNLEWRPTSRLRFKLDSLYTESYNNFGQYDLMATVRSYNNTIPINFQLDSNKVLTSGTFGNAYFLNQSNDARTSTTLFYRSVAGEWDVARTLHLSVAGMMNTGTFKQDIITYTLQSAPGQVNFVTYPAGTAAPLSQPSNNLTPLNTGQYITYTYAPGALTPTIGSNIDTSKYSNYYWNSIQIVPTRQDLKQKSIRADLAWQPVDTINLSTGFMKSMFDRHINSWNVSDCAFRNSCTSVFTSAQTSLTGTVPNSAIPNYLTMLPATPLFQNAPFNVGLNGGWLVPDFAKLRQAVNFDYYINDLNPGDQPSNYLNTYSPRILSENTTSAYAMAEGHERIFDRELRFNLGVRYTTTVQQVAGIVNDFLVGGGTRTAPTTRAKSFNWLPSVNAAYLLTKSLVLRGAAARTVTRPNPSDLAPTFGLSLDGDTFTKGNPGLRPFTPTISTWGWNGIPARAPC